MSIVVSISNQKGGVSKTTTALALGQGLSIEGFNILLVDLDPQSNLSFCFGVNDNEITLYEVLKEEINISEAIKTVGNLDILPSSLLLSSADLEFMQTGREYLLKNALEAVRDIYDYIIIDTPPNLGILTINSLTVSNKVIIPINSEIFSFQGLAQLNDSIESVKKYVNSKLRISGILLTKYNARTILGFEFQKTGIEIAKKLNTKLYNTTIRESVSIREAQAQQKNLFEYAPNNNAVKDYKKFVKEFIKSENGCDMDG